MKIAAADVAYDDAQERARGAIVAFDGWGAERALWEGTLDFEHLAPYAPGRFYERELPCWLSLLERARAAGFDPELLVVDGYASFSAERPALGEHLARATGKPVVGVAKTRYRGAEHTEVLRGTSKTPLFVTAVGVDVEAAARWVREAHGRHRIPTMLARADGLSRGR